MNIGIIGSGTMGSGIAQVAANSACMVKLYDSNQDALNRAKSNLERILENEKKSFKNKKTNIAKMLNALASKIHKRSLVFIFSDFMAIDNPEDFANSIKHLRHHLHEIVVFGVSHHNLENQLNLKNKYYNVVDVETGDSIKMHPKQIKEKYITERNSMKSKIHNLLKQQKVDLISADIEIGFDQILLEYLLKRKKIY